MNNEQKKTCYVEEPHIWSYSLFALSLWPVSQMKFHTT